tara:strand:- start:20276 stop:20464 length:189 start_codon:yes stop_codon:yes gene_type:complete
MSVREVFELDVSTVALVSSGEDWPNATRLAVTATRVARTVILRNQLDENQAFVAGGFLISIM